MKATPGDRGLLISSNSENHARLPNRKLPAETARIAAIRILSRMEKEGAYLDKLLDAEIGAGGFADVESRLLMELATGVTRWRERLDWTLQRSYKGDFRKAAPIVKNALRIALYQILYLDRIPNSAAVNESVQFVKRVKGERVANLVNAVLRTILRASDSPALPNRAVEPAHWLSIIQSHPLWLVERWLKRFGFEECERLLAANNVRPAMSIRVNESRVSPDQLLSELRESGVDGTESARTPGLLEIPHFPNMSGSKAFIEGMFGVQDEAAVMAARLADPRPRMRIIDLCAAPGGKSMAMADRLRGVGEIMAVDKYPAKIRALDLAAKRMGFEKVVHPMLADSTTVDMKPAEIVFVDAPCSGLGVLRKKPDIKWTRSETDLPELSHYQSQLLENAARLVTPGGVIIYSTCTTEPEENEQVVERFIDRHPEFELADTTELIAADARSKEGFLRTYPHLHNTDGAFAARLRKRE